MYNNWKTFIETINPFTRLNQLSEQVKLLLLIIISSVLYLILFYLYLAYFLPLPTSLNLSPQNLSTKIYDRHGQLLYELLSPNQGRKTYLALNQMPQQFVQAVLASEDQDYYNHIGVDLPAIARAFFYNSLEQRVTSGASTITQQLVRNLMGTNRERNLPEKLMEAAYAIRISHAYSKEEVLEQYLNTVYFGNLSYGAEAAALNYFDKNLDDLDLAELSMLAGLPQSPSAYNPLQHPEKAKNRQLYVLKRLKNEGFINDDQFKEASERQLKYKKAIVPMKAPHFVQHILAELEQKYGQDQVYFGGLKVTTTLDYNLQQKAEQIIDYQLSKLSQKNVSSAALLSSDLKNGQIYVWIGSKNYFDSKIDGQVDLITSLRQPGSALKPFLYWLALEKGQTLSSIIPDLPLKIQTANGVYSPLNYDLDFKGPVRLKEALANSLNVPAVRTLQSLGIDNFLDFLRKLGLSSLDQPADYYGLALTLGGGEVRLYDLLHAYATLGNYGKSLPLSDILRVEDQNNQTLFDWSISQQQIQPQKVFPSSTIEKTAYLIISAISDPNARLKSFGEGNVLELSVPAAVKTGTTRNFKDNWTFGFTNKVVTGVWVGNADATSMENISGIDGAGPIWHDYMEYYQASQSAPNQANNKFFQPTGLKLIQICALSGQLATKLCPDQINEWYLSGTEPKQLDGFYQEYSCDKNPNSTPRVYITYPAEYQKWAQERDFLPPASCRPLVPKSINLDSTASAFSNNQNLAEVKDELPSMQILSPLPGDSFQIDQERPLNSQKIPFKFRINTPFNQEISQINLVLDSQIWKNLDSQSFSLSQEQTEFWIPSKGSHTLEMQVLTHEQDKISSQKVKFEVK